MVGSLEKSITGFHPDLFICDDLHSEQNTRTEGQIENAKKVFAEMTSASVKGTRKIVIGTCWKDTDIYSTIAYSCGISDWNVLLKERIHHSKYWTIYLRQCIEAGNGKGKSITIDNFGTFEDSVLFFPKLDAEELSKKYNSPAYTRYTFLCQFFCNPTATKNSKFSKEELDRAKSLAETLKDYRPETSRKYLLCDPAYTVKKKSDSTAFIVLEQFLYNKKEYIRVLLAYKDKLESRDVVDKLFAIRDQYRPAVVAIEANASQQVLSTWIRDKQREKKVFFRITELKTGPTKSKEDRIMAMHSYFKDGTIAIPAEFDDLFDEYTVFPDGSHDDLIDALAFYPPVKKPLMTTVEKIWEPAKEYFSDFGYTPSWMQRS